MKDLETEKKILKTKIEQMDADVYRLNKEKVRKITLICVE